MNAFFTYIYEQAPALGEQTLTHLGLTALSLLMALLIGLPLGIWIMRQPRASSWVLGFANVMQTVPSIALLGFMIPLLGIGVAPALVALFLYALLPIIRNTFTGLSEVDPAVVDAARGMGLSQSQILRQVQMPLALPVIFAGIRTATVINVGVATLAAYIGAGGLGEFIFGGIALNNGNMILAGALPAALLALALDFLLGRLEKLKVRQLVRVAGFLLLGLVLLAGIYFWPTSAGSQARLRAGFEPEFLGRADGLPGLQQAYGLDLEVRTMSPALMYRAVAEGEVDVISGYATDGRKQAFDLVSLVDDIGVFPPYFAAPIVQQQTLSEHPQLASVLEMISGKLDDSTMTALNFRVDHLQENPAEVAQTYLVAQGLWTAPSPGSGPTLIIGSKIFSEQYILAHLYAYLIEGYTDLNTELKLGLGGTKICFDALVAGEIDLYPEYTGTGFQVILAPSDSLKQRIGQDRDAVYAYVDREFQAKFGIDWLKPLGFNNTYALMMSRAKSEKLGIQNISDLTKVASASQKP